MAPQVVAPACSIADPALHRRVAELRLTNNFTNWYYLAREYIFLAIVLAGAVFVMESIAADRLHWGWAVPTLLLANFCVGAGQHRLATLTHEAAHYMLFKNRLLNEIVSEWFCMFPILGTTHSYRVQHLGHHQYPNDPEKDPDWTQLTMSGHKFSFPMSRGRFLWECVVKQLLWPPTLLRYVLVRAFFKVDLDDGTPYKMHRRASPWMLVFSLAYHLVLIAGLAWSVSRGDETALMIWPVVALVGILLVYTGLPERLFASYFIKPDLNVRTTARMRLVFNTLVATTIAWLTLLTGRPCWLYFFLLWMVPLGSSFAFFMVLRQLVQHGNADRERFSNTRVFMVNPLISMAVFPIGNDFHLPHHLFPMVPHFNLRKLHETLLLTKEYREGATIVHGYFLPDEKPPSHPTVLDLMTH